MLVWKPYKTNHLKESTASGTLDCLVSRLQKHYKMTGCSMKSQSCLIMTEWGARLTFEIQTRQAATYMHALLTDTERRKLETWQRMCTHAHTRMHAHTHTDLAPAAHPPPSTLHLHPPRPSSVRPRHPRHCAGVIGELIGCHSMNYEFHTVYRHRWWWHSVLINQCIIIRNSWSSVDVFIFRASVPHTSNLTASITGGGRFVQRAGNTLFYFCPDKQNKEQRLWIDEHRLQEVVQGNVYLRSLVFQRPEMVCISHMSLWLFPGRYLAFFCLFLL